MRPTYFHSLNDNCRIVINSILAHTSYRKEDVRQRVKIDAKVLCKESLLIRRYYHIITVDFPPTGDNCIVSKGLHKGNRIEHDSGIPCESSRDAAG